MVVASSGLHAVAGGCCGLFVETSMQRHVCRALIVLRIETSVCQTMLFYGFFEGASERGF